MNKKRYFILLPLLALLLLINSSMAYHGQLYSSQSHVISSTTFAKSKATCQPVLDKDHQDRIKNKVRIKAWDAYSAIDLAASCFSLNIVVYNSVVIFRNCQVDFRSSSLPGNCLRGPPAVLS